MSQDLERMGEDVRIQGGQGKGKVTDLVFDIETGEFTTREQGSAVTGNEIGVTNMTEDGFAY